MSNITGGMIAVEDGRKEGDQYAPTRKVRVELTFDVKDGQDATEVLDHVGATAAARVKSILFGTAPVAVAAPAPTPAPISADSAEKPTRTRRTKAEMEAARAAEVTPLPAVAPFHPASDPSAIVDDGGAAAPVQADPGLDITDRGLLTTVTDINARVKNAPAITRIIMKYCPKDGIAPSLKRIPTEQRVAFLTELREWAKEQKAPG